MPENFIPSDHHRQVSALYFADRLCRERSIKRVLDLGCGAGRTKAFFERLAPQIRWVGLDVASSVEVDARKGRIENVVTYDGASCPFSDSSFDLVYSRQVMEHVRYPEQVLSEVHRVLSAGGRFVGSTSHLEPFHSNSYWNFTPWGFSELLGAAGFEGIEIRPGIDGLTLIAHAAFLHRYRYFDRFFQIESPFNRLIDVVGGALRKSTWWINWFKLRHCGHFCFWAVKP